MAVKWTREQQKVIDLRDRNILVSAAAGSGKTAVLVERIISMVMDKESPVDIDRLLIVTFTKAAAGEMRERIGQALEERLMADPENQHLQRQTTLLHHAQISTIHGFCSYVIHNYFHMIDLDPGFRMGDEGELKLLKGDVADEVLEAAYAENREEFAAFVESYASGKTDEGIKDLILNLHEYAQSAPWPEEWLLKSGKNYQINTWEEMEQGAWMHFLWKDVTCVLGEALELTRENLHLAGRSVGPHMYVPTLEEDMAGLSYVAEAQDYKTMYERIRLLSFGRLSSKRDEQVDPALKENVKDNRNRVKDMAGELKKQYFFASPDQMLKTMRSCAGPAGELIGLTMAFGRAFEQKKREKNLLDFSDLEHLALQILVHRNEEGSIHVTQAAKELSLQFHEILIDEYQDSNLVQETLLTHVSSAIRGEYNIFMVGDVKQSVYRFRQARPELFMEKLDAYSTDDSKTQRIDLHKNFRSREEVLKSVNFFFQQIMRRELGGVEYDKDAALYAGADFAPGNDRNFTNTEVLALELDGDDLLEEDERKAAGARELEARLIGMRIREIVGKELVWDKKKNAYRPARFGDCVILLRTMSGWAEIFGGVLNGLGIPAYSTSKTGYFSAIEVQTLLNFLRICDNPMQEIPYTAVLTSHFGGCTPKELALIKCGDKESPMYTCAVLYAAEGGDEKLKEKLNRFLSIYGDICERAVYTPIHELIWYLVEKSGYGDYVSALPYGEQRIANVRMLVEKAVDYESTSYGGLFHFIRYMEHLHKYDVDFGEVNIVGENDDTVRIMSIHKSKGLEFPVVFLAGLNKRFNQQDLNGPVLMDADFGVATAFVDYERRVKSPTLMRGALRQKLLKENLGEELRVLYVAMTRAKEKLILTGTINNLDKKVSAYDYLQYRKEGKLPYSILVSANSYWSWILPALVRREGRAPVEIKRFTPADMIAEEARAVAEGVLGREELLHWDTSRVYDEEMKQALDGHFSFRYPYVDWRDIPVKVSVSELKKQSIRDEEAYEPYHEPDVVPLRPRFMQEEETQLLGSGRGTAYHALMERLDFGACENEETVRAQAAKAAERHHLSEAEYACINPGDFVILAQSELGGRMAAAQKNNRLHREQPFVLGVPASVMKSRWPEEETVLVQGIIDAFFYEEDKIILVDYKTDKVGPGGARQLTEKYRVQLDSYAEALERLTGKKVKEKIIYSFTMGCAISLTERNLTERKE